MTSSATQQPTDGCDERDARIAALEDALRLSEARIASTNQFGEALVRLVGHELRNPLSAITTAANLLELRADSEKITKPAGRIVLSAERLERMVVQLVEILRIRLGGGLALTPVAVDLAEISRTLAGDVEVTSARPVIVEARGDTTGVWDRERMTRLLATVIGNAGQHGAAGTGVVVFVNGGDPAVVTVDVRNQGAIAPALLAVLFQPLRSEGRERRALAAGLGLGLYLGQQIALAHGGSIDVESSDDAGTRVVVRLPRRIPR